MTLTLTLSMVTLTESKKFVPVIANVYNELITHCTTYEINYIHWLFRLMEAKSLKMTWDTSNHALVFLHGEQQMKMTFISDV